MQQKHANTHQSLNKALTLLRSFLPYNQEVSASDVAVKLDLHRSTASRLLSVLKQHGFVQQNPETKKYALGSIVTDLALAYSLTFHDNLIQLARPLLDKLRREIGQTAVLEIPEDDRTIITSVAEGFGPIRIKGNIGDQHYFHASAGAKSILAFSTPDFIERILNGDLPRLTPNTSVDPQTLRAELEQIRELGYAFDGEGSNLGISAFGVPVFNGGGRPKATVVVAGASHIVTLQNKNQYIDPLLETAAKLSALLTGNDLENK